MIIIKVLHVSIILSLTVSSISSLSSNVSQAKPGYCIVRLGSSVKPDDRPIAGCLGLNRECPVDRYPPCEIVTRGDRHCNLTFDNRDYWLINLYQLGKNKVLVHTSQSGEHMTLVNMSSCTQVFDIVVPAQIRQVIPYADGSFDVSTLNFNETSVDDRIRIKRFDPFGLLLNSLNIPTGNYRDLQIDTVSSKSRNKGLFVRAERYIDSSKCSIKVAFFPKGLHHRNVLKLDTCFDDVTSRVDNERYYVICGQSRERNSLTLCTRFDLLTNQTYKTMYKERKGEWIKLMDARATNDGVVVFLKMQVDSRGSSLAVVEMRPNQAPIVQRYRWPSDWDEIDNGHVRSFDETNKSFVIAHERNTPSNLKYYEFLTSNELSKIELTNEAVNQKPLPLLHLIFIVLIVVSGWMPFH